MPRFAPVMSQADLRQIIIDKAIANNYVEDYGDINYSKPDLTGLVDMLFAEDLINEVFNDWSKIDFSSENMDVIDEEKTPDGVPYLTIRAGGDWENPLIAIIYFDGKKLRGYVPKDGNTYNHKEKSAFGNHDNDGEAADKQFGHRTNHIAGNCDDEPDMDLIRKDIAERLKAKGEYTYASKPVVSKAQIIAKQQAQKEKGQNLTGNITPDMVYAEISLAAGCSYVEFKLRSSGRILKKDEANRLLGVPSSLRKNETISDSGIIWYAPMGCYPQQLQKILEAAGFEKDPENDISMYQGGDRIIILR